MSKLDDITEKIESLLSDEESMNQIKELAAMLSGGMNGADPQPGNNAADFSASGNASSDDKDCGLLLALRPHLSAEKQKRLDKAVKLLKLYNIFTAMRDNGILNDLENML